MNLQTFQENKCRICWAEDEMLDWNNLIYNHSDLTFRDCFYKYTQLECIDEDRFSYMICQNCSKGLEYIDTFVSRAIEADTKLREMFLGKINSKEEVIDPTIEPESMHVEEVEIKEEENTSTVYEDDRNLCILENLFEQAELNQRNKDTRNSIKNNSHTLQRKNFLSDERKFFIIKDEEKNKISIKMPINEKVMEETVDNTKVSLLVRQLRKCYFKSSNSSKRYKKRNNDKPLDTRLEVNQSYKTKLAHLTDEKVKKIENPSKASSDRISAKVSVDKTEANKTSEKIFLCQYCSAEIKGWSNLHAHEAKHNEVRERTETCGQCGVKFYDKRSLRLHEKIHNVNREKKFKCEFCEKAFYSMGGLNIHRRIHLGLMVKCQICSKEFFRNIELYKHMNSHSSTLINVEVKRRSRYFVRCKHCGKKILSTSFKSHTAAHLNQPLVKCSICNKQYFNRESCRYHIRTIHMKKPETVNDYVVLLKTDRLTSLYIRQNADIEPEQK